MFVTVKDRLRGIAAELRVLSEVEAPPGFNEQLLKLAWLIDHVSGQNVATSHSPASVPAIKPGGMKLASFQKRVSG